MFLCGAAISRWFFKLFGNIALCYLWLIMIINNNLITLLFIIKYFAFNNYWYYTVRAKSILHGQKQVTTLPVFICYSPIIDGLFRMWINFNCILNIILFSWLYYNVHQLVNEILNSLNLRMIGIDRKRLTHCFYNNIFMIPYLF